MMRTAPPQCCSNKRKKLKLVSMGSPAANIVESRRSWVPTGPGSASDSCRWERNLLTDILDRAIEIYPALEIQAKLEEKLERK